MIPSMVHPVLETPVWRTQHRRRLLPTPGTRGRSAPLSTLLIRVEQGDRVDRPLSCPDESSLWLGGGRPEERFSVSFGASVVSES